MLNQKTDILFSHARSQARWGMIRSALTRHSRRLLALPETNPCCTSRIAGAGATLHSADSPGRKQSAELRGAKATHTRSASCCAMRMDENPEVQTIPISQIHGSVSPSRSNDFDRDFNPLHDRTNERWSRIAAARQQGKALPPVSLVQVGDEYFVKDGHHRISVERVRGQKEVTARVTVCHEDQRDSDATPVKQ